jgi:four helix bundle protein
LAEAWRKRRYEGAFLLKLSDAEAEAAETETWLEFAAAYQYLDTDATDELRDTYDHIMGILVKIIANPSPWLLPTMKARD